MDPDDPRCPDCGGPVAYTASYCMHCEADLPGADFDARETASGLDADAAAGGRADADAASRGGERGGVGERAGVGRLARWVPRRREGGGAPPDDAGWFHPDGLLDDVSTVAAGLVAGPVVGVLASAVLLLVLPDVWPFVVGVVAWLVATVWVARTRTVFGAVRKAGYLVGGLLAALPLSFAATAPMAENTLGQRLGFAVVLGIFVWPFAVVAAAAGVVAGFWAADGDGDGDGDDDGTTARP